ENTSTDTYTLSLTRAPAAGETVTVTLIYDATQLSTSVNSVTFDINDWFTAKTITVSGVNDGSAENDQLWAISHQVTSSLPGGVFAGITEEYEVVVMLGDDDAGGVTVTQSNGSTIVDPLTTDYYDLGLTKAPTAAVT